MNNLTKHLISWTPILCVFGVSIYGLVTGQKQKNQYDLVMKYKNNYNYLFNYSESKENTSINNLFCNKLKLLWSDNLSINSFNDGIKKYKNNNDLYIKNDIDILVSNSIKENSEVSNSLEEFNNKFLNKINLYEFAEIDNYWISTILICMCPTILYGLLSPIAFSEDINLAIKRPIWLLGYMYELVKGRE